MQVERGKATVARRFDLRPREAPIEVRLTRGGEEVQARERAGRRRAARRAGDDPLPARRLRAPPGRQRDAPRGDRASATASTSSRCTVADLTGASVCFDLDHDERASSPAAPTAVEPYLHGDLPAASQALDRAGQTRAREPAARRAPPGARREREGRALLRGRRPRAARPPSSRPTSDDASHVGDALRAGRRLRPRRRALPRDRRPRSKRRRGLRGGLRLRRGHRLLPARRRGDKVLELLEKIGRYFEAGQAALAAGRRASARSGTSSRWTCATRTTPRPAARSRSCSRSAATSTSPPAKLGEAVAASGDADAAPLELLEQLGDLLERAGPAGARPRDLRDDPQARLHLRRRRAAHRDACASCARASSRRARFATRAARRAPRTAVGAAAGREPLRDPGRDRPRRHGRRLPGARPAPRPQRRAEAPARQPAREPDRGASSSCARRARPPR